MNPETTVKLLRLAAGHYTFNTDDVGFYEVRRARDAWDVVRTAPVAPFAERVGTALTLEKARATIAQDVKYRRVIARSVQIQAEKASQEPEKAAPEPRERVGYHGWDCLGNPTYAVTAEGDRCVLNIYRRIEVRWWNQRTGEYGAMKIGEDELPHFVPASKELQEQERAEAARWTGPRK